MNIVKKIVNRFKKNKGSLLDERWESRDEPPFPNEPIIDIFCDEIPWYPIRPNSKPPNFRINHDFNCGCKIKPLIAGMHNQDRQNNQ